VVVENIAEFMSKYQELITYYKERIIDLDQSITNFMRREKQFTSANFLIFLSNIKKIDFLNIFWP